MEKPQVEQASGYSFAPDYVPKALSPVDKSGKQLMDTLSNFTQAFLTKRSKPDDGAFMEGITDQVNKQVEENSWLTSDSYTQGVQYSKFNTELEAASAGARQIQQKYAQLAASNDPKKPFSMEAFDEEVRTLYSTFNTKLDEYNLTGESRVLAQKQLLGAYTTNRVNFQKELELVTTRNLLVAEASAANVAVTNILSADAAPSVMDSTLNDLVQGSMNQRNAITQDKDSPEKAFTLAGNTMKSMIANIDAEDPRAETVMTNMRQYIGSDKAMSTLGSSYLDVQGALNKKMLEIQSNNGTKSSLVLDNLELELSAGKDYIRKDFTQDRAELERKRQAGTLSLQDFQKLYSRSVQMEIKHFKDAGTNQDLMSDDPLVRRSTGGADADNKATNLAVQQFSAVTKDLTQLGSMLIQKGNQSINPTMVKEGVKQWAPTVTTLANMPLTDFDKDTTKYMQQQWSQFAGLYGQYKQTNPAVAQQMIDALPEGIRDSVEDAILDGHYLGRDPKTDFSTIQGYIARRKATKEGGGYVGKFANSAAGTYTAESIEQSQWTRLKRWAGIGWGDKGSGVESQDYVTEPNEKGREAMALSMNQAKNLAMADGYLGALERKGTLIGNLSDLTNALTRGGYVVMTPTGPVAQSPRFLNDVKLQATKEIQRVTGTAVPPDNEILGRAFQSLKTEYWNRYKDKLQTAGIDEEDVVMHSINGVLKTYVHRNGDPTPLTMDGVNLLQTWGPSYVAERVGILYKRKVDAEKNASYPVSQFHAGKQNVALTNQFRKVLPGFAEELLPTLLKLEGNTENKPLVHKQSDREVTVVSMGVNVSGDLAKDPLRAAIINAKTKPERDAALNNFLADYYKGFDKLTTAAGLVPVSQATVETGRTAHLALAAAHYHGPASGKDYARILQVAKNDPAKAKAMLPTMVGAKDMNEITKGKFVKSDRYQLYLAGIDAARFAEVKRKNNQAVTAHLPKASDFGLPMRGQKPPAPDVALNLPRAEQFGLPTR